MLLKDVSPPTSVPTTSPEGGTIVDGDNGDDRRDDGHNNDDDDGDDNSAQRPRKRLRGKQICANLVQSLVK